MKTGFVNLFACVAIASSSMFVPTLARDFGASLGTISLTVASYNLALFIAYYLFSRASDVYGRRMFLKAGLLASVIAFGLQAFTSDPGTLLAARTIAGFAAGMFPAALTAYVLERREDMGRFNAYGSLGWALGTLVAGFLAYYREVFIMGSLSFILAYLTALRLPHVTEKRIHVPLLPAKLIRKNLNVYTAFILRHTGANMAWTILPLYMSNLGASTSAIGVLYAINTGTQAAVMHFIGGYKSQSLINAGLLLSALVFVSYPLATNYLQVAPIQVMLGVAWSALYVGCLKTLDEENVEKATSTGLLYAAGSLAAIIGPLICGLLPDINNYEYVMAGAALITLASFAADNLRRTAK